MIEKPYKTKSKIRYDGREMKIIMPVKKDIMLIIFSLVWIPGAIYALISGGPDMNGESGEPMPIFFTWEWGWTIGIIFISVLLIWTVTGRETIIFNHRYCHIKKGIFEFVLFSKTYELTHIKNLKINPVDTEKNFFGQPKNGQRYGFNGGKIQFDYGMKTKKFGTGIDQPEAQFLIEEIKRYGYFKETNPS
jgi:hypothetical protein